MGSLRKSKFCPDKATVGSLSGPPATLSEEVRVRGLVQVPDLPPPLVSRDLPFDVEKGSHEGGYGVQMGKVSELHRWRARPHCRALMFTGPCGTHICVCACVLRGAMILTRGCLRFLPGRPTFRAVVLGSCRSSLARASSCSSPSCGHRYTACEARPGSHRPPPCATPPTDTQSLTGMNFTPFLPGRAEPPLAPHLNIPSGDRPLPPWHAALTPGGHVSEVQNHDRH